MRAMADRSGRTLAALAAPLTLIAAVAVVVSGCLGVGSTPTPATPTGEPAPDRRPVIIDADMDISDLAAIAILLRDPRLDVRAIAIGGTGLVHCAGGMRVTRYLLDEMGTPDIPFGCGREDGGPDAHPFPDEWRVVADDGYGLDIVPKPSVGLPDDAATVIARAIEGSPSAPTIIALGPWTNLEDAFAADPTLSDRVAGIHAMLGTVDAPGNVHTDTLGGGDPLEWNAYADPSAVAAVFATDVPIDLVPLDATDDVPVPADLIERLAADHAAAGADLLYELLLRHPARLLADEGQQLWDELAALTISLPELVTWSKADMTAGADGRITRDDAGRPVRYAAAADRGATETALLEALRRGGPRATPFSLGGTIAVTFDGTTCTATREGGGGTTPGLYQLRYSGPAGTPNGVFFVGVDATATWADLTAYMGTVALDGQEAPPDWLVLGAQAADEAGDGRPIIATFDLEDAVTYGPVCLTGTWPDFEFTAGTPLGG